ncbi:hypothetical protein F4808DRAFT_464156 [Astrocystis sublimbata]|nr:hypothetical protein F4808DRAFT_464156 [Astrocystis sublimbata]
MFSSRPVSPRGDAQVSQLEPENDSVFATRTGTDNSRKRPRLENDREEQNEPLPAACDQCRLRKVRCDRQQPECSNCRKGGFECNSSNTLKRVNHMKQLRDDFSDVRKQLDEVGHTLGVLTEITRQITSRPCAHSTQTAYLSPRSNHTSPESLPLPAASGLPDLIQQHSLDDRHGSTDSRAANMPPSETIELEKGGERLYSYPAPLVLMKSMLHQAKGLLANPDQGGEGQESGRAKVGRGLQDPVARATLQRKLETFPFQTYQDLTPSNDMSPITTPPRLMVNLFVDGYLRNVNTRTPIFNESKLHHAIDAHYSDKQLQDSKARALILNNIVLLELSLEIQTGRASSASRVPNDDILPSFLRNCDRAINNLDAFMAPSIVSLQALMTLNLAAQEFYSDATAERVCQAACQVGRLMGIHRSKNRRQTEEDDVAGTHGRLFRILYAMDKQRVFMTGQPCDLHLFDSDQRVGLRRDLSNDEIPISDAFDHLMTIWEEIYLNLYSCRATHASTDARFRQVQFVNGSLDKFAQAHATLLSPSCATHADDAEDAHLSRIELQYGFQVSQILALRRDQDNEDSQSKIRDLARSSLRLLLEVRSAPLNTARFALLARLFRRYPMVAFAELVAFRLASSYDEFDATTTLLTDVSLLRDVCALLEMLQYDQQSHIFYARLGKGLVWAIETLETLVEMLIRPSSARGQGGFMLPQQQQQPPQQLSGKDSRRPGSSRNRSAVATRSPTPDMFDSSRVPSSRGSLSVDISRMRPSRQEEKDFGGQMNASRPRHAEMTSFGFFTPDPERVEMMSAPLSPVYQTTNSAFPAAHPQLELGSGPLAGNGNGNWNFNLDFLQGAFAQGSRWE